MDAVLQQHAREAIDRLQHVLDRGSEVHHSEIQAAVLAVTAFRNRAIERHRRGTASDACLAQANALVSLAYGAEFPLSGLHSRRITETCEGMRKLLASETTVLPTQTDMAGVRETRA